MTIYRLVMTEQPYFQVKQIYRFARENMYPWFPKLTSYQAINHRLNRLSETFKALATELFTYFVPEDCDLKTSLTDSMPQLLKHLLFSIIKLKIQIYVIFRNSHSTFGKMIDLFDLKI